MLLKITDFCSRGCTHCSEDSTIKGVHMTEEIFRKALVCSSRVERLAWEGGYPPIILFSGGECTEHPDIVRFLEIAIGAGFLPMLITNGMWLENKELREAILRPEWPFLQCQVMFDERFYPQPAPPQVEDKRLFYRPPTTHLVTLGRAARKKKLDRHGIPEKGAPSSFNFRSMTRHFGSIEKAVAMLRVRSIAVGIGACTPSITSTGDFVAGESKFCFKIGTVDSSNEELTKAACAMRCNNCGLVDNLTMEQKRAIGETVLFGADE